MPKRRTMRGPSLRRRSVRAALTQRSPRTSTSSAAGTTRTCPPRHRRAWPTSRGRRPSPRTSTCTYAALTQRPRRGRGGGVPWLRARRLCGPRGIRKGVLPQVYVEPGRAARHRDVPHGRAEALAVPGGAEPQRRLSTRLHSTVRSDVSPPCLRLARIIASRPLVNHTARPWAASWTESRREWLLRSWTSSVS